MKRFFAVLCTALVLFSLLPFGAFAAGATVELAASSSDVRKTDTVEISLQLRNNAQTVGSVQFALFYDPEAFEYVEGSLTSDYFAKFEPSVKDDGTIRFAQFGGNWALSGGTLIKVSFRVKAAAVPGKSYSFGVGSKGRTTFLVSSSGGTDGDIFAAPASEEGLITQSVQVRIRPIYTVRYTDGVAGQTVFADYETQASENDATPKYPGTPTRSGYVFAGWSPAVAAKVTKDVTYTATWRAPASFTVRYTDGVDGETVFEDVVIPAKENDATPAYPGTPTREGYVFAGWSPTVAAKVTKDVTYVAKWQLPDTRTVKYTDGVEGETVFEDQEFSVPVGSATPAFAGTPEREGYVFLGWYPAVAAKVTEDAEYAALWEKQSGPPEYTVRYTDGVDGETVFEDRAFTVRAGEATPAFGGDPARSGYRFTGWSPAVDETVTASATYVATWEKLPEEFTYRVTYTDGLADHATGFPDQIYEVPYGGDTPAFDGTPERVGYRFRGWSPEVQQKVTGSVVYTAVWEEEGGTVTFTVWYTDGVSDVIFEDQSYSVFRDQFTPAFVGTPEREGYEFVGWNPEISRTVTRNVTYTAVWRKIAPPEPAGQNPAPIVILVVVIVLLGAALAVVVWQMKKKDAAAKANAKKNKK